MSYEPDTIEGVREFCQREGQPCQCLDTIIELWEKGYIEGYSNAPKWEDDRIISATPPIFPASPPTEPETDYSVDPENPDLRY